jgi:hypothetical protein
MTVFGLIGKNLEDGALSIIEAGAETIAANISYAELASIVGEKLAVMFKDGSTLGCALPPLTDGDFDVSGISAMMRDWEIVKSIRSHPTLLRASFSSPMDGLTPVAPRWSAQPAGRGHPYRRGKGEAHRRCTAGHPEQIIGEATPSEAAKNRRTGPTSNADAGAAAAAAQPQHWGFK